MADAAENLDTPMSDGGGEWRETLAGDNTEVMESLQSFDTPQAFLEEFNSLKDRNWREDFAGDDQEFAKQLERFDSPASFANSYREAQNKIRSGQLKGELPNDADEKTVEQFRSEHGIPESPEGYLENLPDDLVIGEEDADMVGDFIGALHEANAPPEIAHAALAWYNNFAEVQQEAMSEMDMGQHRETEDALRQEWGADYRANINLVGGLLDKTFGAEAKEALLNARDPDGRGLFNMPEIMGGLARLAREIDPINAIVPPGGDPQQTLTDEINELETYMKENRAKYMKDEKSQARLRELYDIRLRHEARS